MEVLKDIADLEDQVIVKQNLRQIHFEIPAKLTRETYLQITRKI